MKSQRDVLQKEKKKTRKINTKTIPKAFLQMAMRNVRKIANKLTYLPHQGRRECARRRRQLASGFIQPN